MKTIEMKSKPEICFANEHSSVVYKNEFRPNNSHIELIEVTQGTLYFTLNGSTTVAKAGDVIINFYESGMTIYSNEWQVHRSVCARVKWQESECGITVPYFLHAEYCHNISKTISAMLDYSSSEHGSAMFTRILTEADRIAKEYYMTPPTRYTQKARQYVVSHLKQAITQKQVAAELNITPEYLCAVFKKTQGTTLMQYINKTKLDAIVADMQNEGLRLYEASARYGYTDPHYVSRLYKKMFSKSITSVIEAPDTKKSESTAFIFNKETLPKPIYEGRDDLVALYYKAFELMFDNIDYPSKKGWKPMLACMPGIGILWQWDSCIMTFFTNYSGGTFSAFNNLDNLYRLQRNDGYISMAYKIDSEKHAYGERINPPLYAWAEWEGYLISGDSSRFEGVIPKIEALYNFIEKNRRHKNGLYFFEDANSAGMNGSPRGNVNTYGSGICFIDLAAQQSLSALCLSKMYGVLNNTEKAVFFKAENERINALINKHHYCEKTGFYYDLFITANKTVFMANKTAASFWVLLCGAVAGERLTRMAGHLISPDEFYTSTPFATLSKDDPNFDEAGGSWLGASRTQTTFAAIRGLYDCGLCDKAREASLKYLDVLSQVANDKRYGSIWECYSPSAPKPALKWANQLVMSNFVGCGGIGPITVFIENVIGLHFDAHNKAVTFEITADKKCGIENMTFNGAKLSVVYDNGAVTTDTQKPFTLIIKKEGNVRRCDVATGKTYIEV